MQISDRMKAKRIWNAHSIFEQCIFCKEVFPDIKNVVSVVSQHKRVGKTYLFLYVFKKIKIYLV
jgi:hypothetical protein